MNWVFPIAGYGTRTKTLGPYKPLIEVYPNHSILKLCLSGLSSLISKDDTIIFIFSRQQENSEQVSSYLHDVLKELNIKAQLKVSIINETPKGQALTIKKGFENIENSVYNVATYVINSDQIVFFNPKEIQQSKNSIGLYFNTGTSSCFYTLDINKKAVTDVKEKEPISHYASSGVFYFTNASNMLECIDWGIKQKKYHNGELYLGPCMQKEEITYFKTQIKFDLGNEKSIISFKNLTKNFFNGEAI